MRRSLRLAAVATTLAGTLGGAFAAGRSTVPRPGAPDPLRIDHGVPVGVVETPDGVLAAADNYAATGVTASLEPNELREFADTVIDVGARQAFLATSQSLSQDGAPPAGAHVIGSVAAHRLDSYGAGTAEVSEWVLAGYWDGGAVPTQYSALVDLSLRWSGDRWLVVSVRESVPGPVPGLTVGDGESRSTAVWDRSLGGMSAPYYGDS
jgi:hypothetical protein